MGSCLMLIKCLEFEPRPGHSVVTLSKVFSSRLVSVDSDVLMNTTFARG